MRTLDLWLCLLSVLLVYKPESYLGQNTNVKIGRGGISRSVQTKKHSNARKHKPVYGGQYVNSITQFPFMAYIETVKGDDLFGECGGAVLSPKYVLTAAHCLRSLIFKEYPPFIRTKDVDPKNISIYLGSVDLDFAPVVKKVKQYFIHPKNQPRGSDGCILPHDIAVMELVNPLVFSDRISNVRLMTPDLLTSSYSFDLNCIVIGWGQGGPFDVGVFLKFAKVNLISYEECVNYIITSPEYKYSPFPDVCRDMHICTIDAVNSACHGDSGGPLICNHMLVGVVHIAPTQNSCGGRPYTPNLFTRIDIHLRWIKEIMSGGEERELGIY